MKTILRIYLDAHTGAPQLTIGDETGDSYRLMGPTFIGNSKCLLAKTLTVRDAREIRNHLNRADRRTKK